MALGPNNAKVAATGDAILSGFIEPDLAQDYFAKVAKTSVVQQVATNIPLGPSGVKIPHWTGDVTASWVAETGMKPITKGDLSKKVVAPHKIATIFTASAEVVRANPANYLATMRGKVAEAIAVAFDAAVLHGTNSPFGAHLSQTKKQVPVGATDAYKKIGVDALNLLAAADRKWTGTLLDVKAEPLINGAVDANGVPLFVSAVYEDASAPFRPGRILGRPAYIGDTVAAGKTMGFVGDWSQVVWGQVGGISYDISDQATLNFGDEANPNLVSCFQYNLVAIRVEAEYGVLVNDPDAFVRLTI